MADEPVSAWAEPWTRKLRAWLTRHRTGVTGAAAAILAGVVGLSAVLTVQTRANAARRKEIRPEAANAKIEARYNLAVDAIKTFHTGVSEDFLLKEDKFQELRDRLLKSAADFYGKLGPARQGNRPRRTSGTGGLEFRAGRTDRKRRPHGGCAGGASGGAGGSRSR